jgi:hypothetical protein
LVAPRTIPKLEVDPLSAILDSLFHILELPSYLKAVSSILRVITCRAVVTRDPLNVDIL